MESELGGLNEENLPDWREKMELTCGTFAINNEIRLSFQKGGRPITGGSGSRGRIVMMLEPGVGR